MLEKRHMVLSAPAILSSCWLACAAMAMEQSRNGGGKVLTYEEAMTGRRRSGSLSTYLDIGRGIDGGLAARSVPPPQGMGSRRRTYADGELDVFAAERYFKGAMDGDGGAHKDGVSAAVAPVEAGTTTASAGPAQAVTSRKPASSAASVSASSVASANSQTVLLRGGHRRSGGRDKKCCVQVGVLMRSCSGKRSVRVDGGAAKAEVPRGAGDPAARRIDWYRELMMQKASLGLAAGADNSSHDVAAAGLRPNSSLAGTAKVAAIGREVIREEKAAEFTCSSSRQRSFTLVAPVRANAPASGEHEHDNDDDGAGSESSSDLFEIKSLMIGDCPYEPSEASIQWSVATASAADATERGDRVSARWISGGSNGGGRASVPVRPHWDRPPVGLLSGCVRHRAVDVSSAATKAAGQNAPATVAARRRT